MHRQLVVDSSVLIALSRKGELQNRLRTWKGEGYEVKVPRAIVEEVVDEPKKLAQEIRDRAPILASKILASAIQIDGAIEEGLIQVERVNYGKYSGVIDNVRKYLCKLEAKPEHAIGKGDPELIALVIQLYYEFEEKIFVATSDKGLLKALKPFSRQTKYEVLK